MTNGTARTPDAVQRYGIAVAGRDIDAMLSILSPDVELRSPIAGGLIFVGQADVTALLSDVYDVLEDLRWDHEVGDDRVRVLVGGARTGPFRLTDALVFELATDGRISRITPHVRPWLGLSFFAVMVALRVIRRPRLLLRAWRRGHRPNRDLPA